MSRTDNFLTLWQFRATTCGSSWFQPFHMLKLFKPSTPRPSVVIISRWQLHVCSIARMRNCRYAARGVVMIGDSLRSDANSREESDEISCLPLRVIFVGKFPTSARSSEPFLSNFCRKLSSISSSALTFAAFGLDVTSMRLMLSRL